MSLADDFAAACRLVNDEVRDLALEVATSNSLRIRFNQRIATGKDDWNSVLEIDDDRPEYRIGFNVTLKQGYVGVYVWSIVTDLKTGTWQQFIREHVPLDALKEVLQEGLTVFSGWLKANEGIDPLEEARKQAGTDFYWKHTNDDGWSSWMAEMGEYIGQVDEDGEGWLTDTNDDEVFTCTVKNPKDAILQVEAKYRELQLS